LPTENGSLFQFRKSKSFDKELDSEPVSTVMTIENVEELIQQMAKQKDHERALIFQGETQNDIGFHQFNTDSADEFILFFQLIQKYFYPICENWKSVHNMQRLQNKRKLAVEQETEKRMLEIYPDYLNDPVISQDAIEAVHNQRRADVIRAELEYISENYASQFNDVVKRLARKLPSSQQTKDEAVKIIAGKKLSEIKPNYYKQAEIKARREACEALAKLDVNLMFEAKRKELLNFELYRVAVEAKENIDKALDSYKKILRKSEEDLAKTRDVDFVILRFSNP